MYFTIVNSRYTLLCQNIILARYYLLSRVFYTLDRRLSYEAYSPMGNGYNCHIASLI